MIINVTDDNLADGLTALGAIEYLAKTSGDIPYLNLSERTLPMSCLLPPDLYGMRWITEKPVGSEFHRVITLNTAQLKDSPFKRYHPTIAHYAALGLPVPSKPPNPKLANPFEPALPKSLDILIAPWNLNINKMLTLTQVAELINSFDTKRVGILHSDGELKLWEDVSYIPFSHAYYYMKMADCVITVDNEYSRLAQLIDINTHLLLASDIEEEHWVANPKARMIYGNSTTWRMDHIMNHVSAISGANIG